MGYDPRITAVAAFPLRRTVVPAIGQWFGTADSQSQASQVMVDGTVYMSPVVVPTTMTIDRLGATLSSAGSAGAVVRLGLVSSDANGLPSTLVLESGALDGTVVGQIFSSPSQPLAPGLYWFAAVSQGGATTKPTIRTTNHAFAVPASGQNLLSGNTVVPEITGVTGALPTAAGAFAPTVYGTGSIAPSAALRRSA